MKKLTAFLFALTMVFTSTACGEKKKSDVSKPPVEVTVTQTCYAIEEKSIDLSDLAYAGQTAVYDDGICLFYNDFSNCTRFARTDKDFNIVASGGLDGVIGTYSVNSDGSFDAVISETDYEFEYDESGAITNYEEYFENAVFTFRLVSYDSSGNVLSECEIEEISDYYDAEISGSRQLVSCGDGKFFYNFGSGLALFDSEGKIIEINNGDEYYDCYLTSLPNGKILYSNSFSYGYMEEDTVKIPTDLKYTEKFGSMYTQPIRGTGGFIAYFNLSGGLYGLTENDEIILVVDYNKSLISEAYNIFPIDDGKFVISNGTPTLKLCTRRPDDYVESREPIEVWMIERASTQMHNNAKDFSALHDNYFVNVKENVKYEDVPAAMLTGDVPDVLYYSQTGDMIRYTNLGGLADLTPMLEGDTGLAKDDILPNLLDALEYKGGIYTIPEMYSIKALIAKKDFIGDEYRDWSIEEFMEIYDSRPEGMSIFEEPYMYPSLLGQDIWIDYMNGTCNYDSEEFIRLLEIAKEAEKMRGEIDYDDPEYNKKRFSMLKEGRTMFGSNTINTPTIFMFFSDVGVRGMKIDDVSFLNSPESGGKIYLDSCYSITSEAKNPDGAWKFVSHVLTEEEQERGGYTVWSHPLTKKAFDRYLEHYITPPEGPDISKHSINGISYDVEMTASEEQVKRLGDFILSCDELAFYDREIETIFVSEYNRFLNDQITAEECAQNLQSRIEILLAEQT